MYSQAAMPPPAAYAYVALPYSSQPTGYSSGYGAVGGAYANGPPPPPAAAPAPPRSGTDSPSNVLLPVGLDLAALLQSVQQPGPPAAVPPTAGGHFGGAPQQQGVSLAHGMQPQLQPQKPPPQPPVQPSAQEPSRDVQAELQMLLARLHGNG